MNRRVIAEASAPSVRRTAFAVALLATSALLVQPAGLARPAASSTTSTFANAGASATESLLHVFYAGGGMWRMCSTGDCTTTDQDWGADSLTYALALREQTTGATSLIPILAALATAAPSYPAPCSGASCTAWSDVPQWDTIALAREYEATRDPTVLAKAEAAFAFVEGSPVFSLGACPEIRYQQPYGGSNQLKTLETDGNAIKAALLLYHDSGLKSYLDVARQRYAAVRDYFLDPTVPLYSVYVFDDGRTCTLLPHRFFASVNGDMIWSGIALSRDTGQRTYLREALATARAVDLDLNDARGIFTDLQAENDIVEPLVEAMYVLAADEHVGFARSWILRNAAAALGARTAAGAFGRFFDGPPPASTVTAWQANGGFALEIAAAALAPERAALPTPGWSRARFVTDAITSTTAHLTFRGEGIALIGTLGEHCCESGHARVLLDGQQTFDHTGIWQNKSSAGISIPHTILFAWRWPVSGRHTLRFEPGIPNGKEGSSFLDIQGYFVIPG